jgi:hypothetical protein
MDQYDEFIPPMPVPAIPELKLPDPVKSSRSHGIPQSRSEGHIHSPKLLQLQHNRSHYHLGQSDGTDDHSVSHARGRVSSQDSAQAKERFSSAKEEASRHRAESRKRSRSPVKRFLGLGKSQSMKEIPQEKEAVHEDDKKAGLKLWGERLRHGFLVRFTLTLQYTHTNTFRRTLSPKRLSPPLNRKSAEAVLLLQLNFLFPLVQLDKRVSKLRSSL